ncbi:MAG TPA: Ger(x)C family spore germination protein [Acetivibrio sp.]|mgnify:FL=1|nr:Ger(x)C family spore germination protein [Acetivibrio sp.]
MKLNRLLLIILVCQILLLSGCWSSHEVNTLGITVCIGIDKTENGYLVSMQILNPATIASDKSARESPIVIYSVEVSNMAEVTGKIMLQLSRKINNAHLRLVVFGEDVAREGIENILDYLARNHEFRTDYYFAVAKNSTAKEILGILTPIETVPGVDMYNSIKISEEEWASLKSMRIIELINSIMADGKNPVLTGIEIEKNNKIDSNTTAVLERTDGYSLLKLSDSGAFNKDKLIGWLDENESKGYNYITGNVKRTLEDAQIDEAKITSTIMKAKSDTKVHLSENEPSIEVKIKIEQNIASIEGKFEISSKEQKRLLDEMFAVEIKSLCEKALNKAQKELKTDIFGFGETIHRKYPKMWKKMKDNWDDIFPNLPVNITVEVDTKQLGGIGKPLFMKEEE